MSERKQSLKQLWAFLLWNVKRKDLIVVSPEMLENVGF